MIETEERSVEAAKVAGGIATAVTTDTETESSDKASESRVSAEVENKKPKSFRFYSIIVAIVFCGVLTALEGSIIPTSLPSIVADLGGGEVYIWASNGYYVGM